MSKAETILFFNEAPIKYRLEHKTKIRQWINSVAEQEKHQILQVNYIFCNDEYLLQLNQQYLNHQTYTDIITFDNSDEKGFIESDIFISLSRVKENATTFKVRFIYELYRVMIHGLLHLCGFADKTKTEKKVMRNKEDFYLVKMIQLLG